MEKVCACDPPGETSAETKLPAHCAEPPSSLVHRIPKPGIPAGLS